MDQLEVMDLRTSAVGQHNCYRNAVEHAHLETESFGQRLEQALYRFHDSVTDCYTVLPTMYFSQGYKSLYG